MKRALLEYIPAWMLLIVLAMIVVHAPITVYVGSQFPEAATTVKAWKELLILVAAVLVLPQAIHHSQLWNRLKQDTLAWLMTAYLLLHAGALAWTHTAPQAIIAGLIIDGRFVLYALLIYIFVQLYPAYRTSFVRVSVLGAIIVVGFACLQLVLPRNILSVLGYNSETIAPYLTVDKNESLARVNSTLRGPNPLGAYAVIVIAGLAAASKRLFNRHIGTLWRYLGGILAITATIALWISYSRSALAAGVIAIIIVLAVRYSKKPIKSLFVSFMVAAIVGGGIMFGLRSNSFVSNVLWHDNPADSSSINSNEGHIESLADGLQRMVRQPLGAGIGSTGSASLLSETPVIIENQYLFIAHEVGWAGLTVFLTLFSVLLRRLWIARNDWLALGLFASGVGLAFIGLLLPVWVDDTVSLVWWGLAAVAVAYNTKYGQTTN
ncbi:MAG: O-antigen ligase family protein [Candidatus Saccharimonas sp.]